MKAMLLQRGLINGLCMLSPDGDVDGYAGQSLGSFGRTLLDFDRERLFQSSLFRPHCQQHTQHHPAEAQTHSKRDKSYI
jgi:hypothetical protein